VHKANRDVVEISRTSPEHRGMGTTVVAACFSPRSSLVHVAHVGDSRCYRLRGGHLEQLTQDHSLLTDALEQRPELEEDVLARLPRNIVTRVLGLEDQVRVSIRSYAVAGGDRYLLCSDGLSGPVPAGEIAETLRRAEAPAAIAEKLVALANRHGGPDNVAAIVIEFQESPATVAGPAAPAIVQAAAATPESPADPELLILGIQDLDVAELMSASDDLLKAIEGLLGKR
jgi:protein phosphatase